MKTCPVCKTSLFDDMEVCYGCMYTFGSKPELEQRASEQYAQEQLRKQLQEQAVQRPGAPKTTMPMAGWSVRLEMRDEADPGRSWSMELLPPSAMAEAAVAAANMDAATSAFASS